ncbi:MAG: carboxypeptidase M32 [Phycisphaerales bacterium]|nr:carboxypeptidase M32 [Phycisphaerales bacterium]
MPTTPAYADLLRHARQLGTLRSIGSLVQWDHETYMPEAAADHRAEQEALLASLAHERATSKQFGDLIAACEQDKALTADPQTAANLREFRRDYDLATKLPADLVEEWARTSVLASEVWKKARAAADFKAFEPYLTKMIALARRKAECYGWPTGGEPYDALLNEYEPGATAKQVEAIFNPLRQRLAALIKDIADNGTPPDESPINVRVPDDAQHKLGLAVLKALCFDLSAGRLDVTTHPFCSGMAPGDTRLTTRYRDERFTDALYGTMHECGHGLYEQGLPKLAREGHPARFGEPLGDAISLGIHESQSRLWENFVGRSPEFWQWLHPIANQTFNGALAKFTPDAMFRAVNTAKPSFIRVEADEATYNLHIMLRFTIERALLRGDLEARDVPGAWNDAFGSMLGLKVPDDRRGCLQDIHWSAGLIGYFPTYCLGNLYAAQFWETVSQQIPDLKAQIARGQFAPLREWLRTNIHQHGRRYLAGDLCQRITGKPLSADPLMRYLEGKLRPVYGL